MVLDDLRLFAAVADAQSFTGAARRLGVPKQTLSRRIAALEEDLGVRLLHRTTRRLRLTEAGAAYAARCAEVVRLADEARRAVGELQATPRGLLRVTADPVLGEAFLGPLVIAYARRFPEVQIDLVLTRRHVDLVAEGFDLGFRVGGVRDPALDGTPLGPARVRYCASPRYLRTHGVPRVPGDLAQHACVLVTSEASGPPLTTRWPFRGARGPLLQPVTGRLRFDSLPLARDAVLAGLGIGLFPEFTCVADLRARRLTAVLDEHTIEAGGVWLVRPQAATPTARVRSFVELALAGFSRAPWNRGAHRR